VSEEDLRVLRPAVFQMHPVRRTQHDPSPTGGAEGAQILDTMMQALREQGVRVLDTPPAPPSDPWAGPPMTMTIKYADAAQPENAMKVAKSIHEHRVAVYVKSVGFRKGEPQIWIVPDSS